MTPSKFLKTTSAYRFNKPDPLSIVAIGSSAGGLEALEQFFTNMPPNSGFAFVLISHLLPNRKSLLPELLQNYTQMKIRSIENGDKLQSNTIYILPPSKEATFVQGTFHLTKEKGRHSAQMPINTFFKSLAESQHPNIIGIILSGTGMDGTLGLSAIKKAGGKIIVQKPSSAKYDGMPQSAINTKQVDAILSPNEIPQKLIDYIHPTITTLDSNTNPMEIIFSLLLSYTGKDFSSYKPKTITRRIEKRMKVHHLNTFLEYAHYLEKNPLEAGVLFKDFLIGVTQFFRDPLAFESLKQHLIKLLNTKDSDDMLRVWVPSCSTGEEAYSIAIILCESMKELKRNFPVQIFATDINEISIKAARAGVYTKKSIENLNALRLRHFFIRNDNKYVVRKEIRKMLIFANQDVINDPPFIKLDLLCCRNLLIYLDNALQKKLIPLFHYSLKSNGLLFLGTSESIGGFGDLFQTLDRKWKIFQAKAIRYTHQAFITFPSMYLGMERPEPLIKENADTTMRSDISDIAEDFLLKNYAPACVVVNKIGDILYVQGKTGKYLEPASGKARFNVLAMVHSGLKSELMSALQRASASHQEVAYSHLSIKEDNHLMLVNLKVTPITAAENKPAYYLIAFEPTIANLPNPSKEKKLRPTGKWAKRVIELEKALKETNEALHIAIEEHHASIEELQSTNEELQSNNEEIETSKEELQSLNEELVTVNSELQSRIEQLSSANDDMKNLLDSNEIATLFLDKNLCVKRFTPEVTQLINLLPSDIGRPVSHLTLNLKYEKLIDDVLDVLQNLNPKSIDTQNKDGQWYNVRIAPYRTIVGDIDGVVVNFLNIDAQKKTSERLRALNVTVKDALQFANAVINTIRESLLVLDTNFKVVSANRSFYQMFQITATEVEGQSIFNLCDQHWNIPQLKKLLTKIISEDDFFEDFAIEQTFPHIGRKKMLLKARKIVSDENEQPLILLTMEEVS